MAHRTNVIQVGGDFGQPVDERPKVQDPVCGMELERKTARHVLFRPEVTYYFCSPDCMKRFSSGKYTAPKQQEKKAA